MNALDFTLLQSISLPSYDNGYIFTDRTRLEAIHKIAAETSYQTKIEKNRFTLFAKKPLGLLPDRLIVISSHIDSSEDITKFYAESEDDETIRGTFDNTLTNAAALSLMREGALPDNVVFAFTADEERSGLGATDVVAYLRKASKSMFAIVLDVSDVGYGKVNYTVENDFWRKRQYDAAIGEVLANAEHPYRFVSSGCVPPYYIPLAYVEKNSDGGIREALCDESWSYEEEGVECFSLCIPIKGAFHSDEGVLCRKCSFPSYKRIISAFAQALANVIPELS